MTTTTLIPFSTLAPGQAQGDFDFTAKNTMKPIQTIFLSIALISAVQSEPLDEHHKLATELVDLTSTNRPDEAAFKKTITDQIDQVIPQLGLDAKDSELFREAALGATESITTDQLIGMLANAYAKRLTIDELRGIVAFYKTDAGKAWMREGKAIESERLAEQKAAIGQILKYTKQRFEDLKKLNPK